MAGKSDYLENKVLDHLFGRTTYTAPATLYIALFTAPPTDAGGGTEVAGGSYARAAVTNDVANWPNAVAGSKTHANAIAFAQASAGWGTITHAGVFDALSGGNLLFWGALQAPKTVQSGDQFSFTVGSLIFTED